EVPGDRKRARLLDAGAPRVLPDLPENAARAFRVALEQRGERGRAGRFEPIPVMRARFGRVEHPRGELRRPGGLPPHGREHRPETIPSSPSVWLERGPLIPLLEYSGRRDGVSRTQLNLGQLHAEHNSRTGLTTLVGPRQQPPERFPGLGQLPPTSETYPS